MIDYKIIIERIKEITGKTQKDIALLIFDISDKNLSNKIKRNSVDLDALINWAGNVNVNLNWLFTGKGEMFLEESDIYKDIKDELPIVSELLEDARKVLKSGNKVAFETLERNILYFSNAVETEKHLESTETQLSNLEQKFRYGDFIDQPSDIVRTRNEDQDREEALKRCSFVDLVRIRKDDPPESREEILKQRTR